MSHATIRGARHRSDGAADPAAVGSGATQGDAASSRRRLRRSLLGALTLAAASGGSLCLTAGPAAHADAPVVPAHSRAIQGQYIVVLHDGADARAVASRHGVHAK